MSIWDAFGKGRYKGFSREAGQLLDKAVENGLAQRTADGWMPTLEGMFRGEVL